VIRLFLFFSDRFAPFPTFSRQRAFVLFQTFIGLLSYRYLSRFSVQFRGFFVQFPLLFPSPLTLRFFSRDCNSKTTRFNAAPSPRMAVYPVLPLTNAFFFQVGLSFDAVVFLYYFFRPYFASSSGPFFSISKKKSLWLVSPRY